MNNTTTTKAGIGTANTLLNIIDLSNEPNILNDIVIKSNSSYNDIYINKKKLIDILENSKNELVPICWEEVDNPFIRGRIKQIMQTINTSEIFIL